MAVSKLADQRLDIPAGNRWNPRDGEVVGFTIHQQAGYNAHGAATDPSREVSAQYWIDNEGPIRPQVNEEYRAFTTGAPGYPEGALSDHRNITAEVSNTPEGVRNRTWDISENAKESLAALIGDVFRRYKLGRVRRGTHGGVAVHRDFVATECPGEPMMRALPDIIERAEWYRVNGGKPGDRLAATTDTNLAPEPKRKRKNMIGLTIADGENRYKLGKNKRLYATFDGRCFVSLTKDDADAVSVNMGEAFANVSYGGWEAYRDAAEVLK